MKRTKIDESIDNYKIKLKNISSEDIKAFFNINDIKKLPESIKKIFEKDSWSMSEELTTEFIEEALKDILLDRLLEDKL